MALPHDGTALCTTALLHYGTTALPEVPLVNQNWLVPTYDKVSVKRKISFWTCNKKSSLHVHFGKNLLTSHCKNTESESVDSTIDFLYDFTLFAIDMHQIGPFHFFQHHLTTFTFIPLPDSVATISRFFVIFWHI